VRRYPPAARTPLQAYHAGPIEILIRQRPGQGGTGLQDLRGLILSQGQVPEAIQAASVELYRGDRLIAIEPVTPRGQFALDALSPRTYELCLVWQEQEIWLREIQVA
jgi:hypothetical protein